MTQTIRAVFRNGTFVPQTPPKLAEESEVELTIHGPTLLPPTVTDPDERARILRELIESMNRNPIPADAPRFTREELHERR